MQPQDGGLPPGTAILVCDHRGEHLAQRLSFLATSGYRVEFSENVPASLALVARMAPDLIVLDALVHGGAVELEVLERARAGEPPIPLLMVIDGADPLPSLGALRRIGVPAWDFVHRAAAREELLLRLQRLLAQRAELRQLNAWRERAHYDERTLLLRAQAFEDHLQRHFSAAARHGLELALLLLDLDRFGEINKRIDHIAGDEVIARVGRLIRDCLRGEDCAGRLGGDEFAILLPYTSSGDALCVAERLRDALHGVELAPAAALAPLSASIGLESFDGRDIESATALRARAERALRVAKASGGNRALRYRDLPHNESGPRPISVAHSG